MRFRVFILVGILSFFSLSALANNDVLPSAGRTQAPFPKKARLILGPSDSDYYGDERVGTYVSSTKGFSTSSYWIEGPKGLVLIDTQFLPSAAEELIQWAETVTGKKVVLAFVLHANPDKFNGVGVFRRHGIEVLTSAQVLAQIPKIHEKRLKAFYDRFQPDYPKELTVPTSFGSKTIDLSAAGIQLTAHVLGAGCSEAHVAIEFDGHLFVGDLVANGSHSWLELGKVDEWIHRIDELKELHPSFIHPGRGPSGDERLLDAQMDYLHTVKRLVMSKIKSNPANTANPKVLEEIKTELMRRYVGYRFDIFVDFGLAEVWNQLARRNKKHKPTSSSTK